MRKLAGSFNAPNLRLHAAKTRIRQLKKIIATMTK
jgi:hypothetical protein